MGWHIRGDVSASRRSVVQGFLLVPFAARKKPKKRKVSAKPTTVATATTLAAQPPLTLAPAAPSSVPAAGSPTPTTTTAAPVTTALTAAELVAKPGTPVAVPQARAFVVGLSPDRVAALRSVLPSSLSSSLDLGVLGVSTVCTHQSCPTTLCASSGWWECACHGSRFDALGFRRAGPAPRGLDYLALSASPDGKLIVDARSVIPGVAADTASVAPDASGPMCV
jgi:Rieske Fe-S protein